MCARGVGGERLSLSPGGLKSQLEEEGKRKRKASEPTRPLPSLREQLRGVRACVEGWCACCEARVRVHGEAVGVGETRGGNGGIWELGYTTKPCSSTKT